MYTWQQNYKSFSYWKWSYKYFGIIYIHTDLYLLKRFYLFIFRERGREGEREGEKHQCVVASLIPPAGDLACSPGSCPDWESNQWLFGSEAGTQSTPARAMYKPLIYSKTSDYYIKLLLFWYIPMCSLYLIFLVTVIWTQTSKISQPKNTLVNYHPNNYNIRRNILVK